MYLGYRYSLLTAALMFVCLAVTASDDLESWLESDDDTGTQWVNEGDPVFLTEPKGHRVLQTRNWLTITANSMRTGWVKLDQCQSNLDPVPDIEVVYRYHGLRSLQIISSHNVGRAWVDSNSVQMQDVTEGGVICIQAEVQVLHADGKGGYMLLSGPFHRRFLDGYYPVQLDYRIRWPADQLQLASVQPVAQAGFAINKQHGELGVHSLFEGKLTIEVGFTAAGKK